MKALLFKIWVPRFEYDSLEYIVDLKRCKGSTVRVNEGPNAVRVVFYQTSAGLARRVFPTHKKIP